MSDKLEILKMIESGKITVDEGLQMIEALEQTERIQEDSREEIYESTQEKAKIIEKEIYPSSNEKLYTFDVSLTTCKLNVERSNVEDITIELLDDKTREFITKPEWLYLDETNNVVTIKEKRVTNLTDIFDFFKIGNTMSNAIFINVKLPRNCSIDKGKFNNVSGSVSLIGLKGIDIEAKSISGKVYVADLVARVAVLKSTSGSVIADNIRAARGYLDTVSGKLKFGGDVAELELKTVSGSVEALCKEMLDNILAKTVSGKVSISVKEPEKFNLQLASVSGGIETNGFAIVDKATSGKKSVYVNNRSQSKSIIASTVSGKIIIDKLQ